MYQIEVLDNHNAHLGESPLWDDRNECLYYVDYRETYMRRIDWNTKDVMHIPLDIKPSCIALTDEDSLICGAADGKIYLISPDGKTTLFSRDFSFKGNRFNDGKVGPDGRYYVGSKGRDFGGALYRVDGDGTVSEVLSGIGNSNGMAWNRKGNRVYYCDSYKRILEVFDFEPSVGLFLNAETVMDLPFSEECVFDGLTIDSEDNLWIAIWNGGCILKVDPQTAEIIERIDFPVPKTTCPVFAGKDLSELVVTSSRFETDLAEIPQAGYTFKFKTNIKGTLTNRFKIKFF